jgi:hypothetical protein
MKKTKPETMETPHFENGTLDSEIAAIKEPENLSEKNKSNWRKLQETADRYKKEVEELKKNLHETQRRLEPFLHLESSNDILATTTPQAIAMLAATLYRENMSTKDCIQTARELLQLAAVKPAVDISEPDWSEFDKAEEFSENLSFDKQLSLIFPRDKPDAKKKKLKDWLQSDWSSFLEMPDERKHGRFTIKPTPMCVDFIAAGELIAEWEKVGAMPYEIFANAMQTRGGWWEVHKSIHAKSAGAKGGNAKAVNDRKGKQGQVKSKKDKRIGSKKSIEDALANLPLDDI